MRHALAALLVLLTISSGCSTTGNYSGTPNQTTANNEDTDVNTPSESAPVENLTSEGVACDDDLWVAFWRTSEERFWQPDVVRVSYTVPSNTSFLLATYVDGAVRGVTNINRTDKQGEVADGAKLKLESPLSGEHVVQVVIYGDENGNGRLDFGVDPPCLHGDDLVQTGPKRIDFSRFD